jgi:hypothetical protein
MHWRLRERLWLREWLPDFNFGSEPVTQLGTPFRSALLIELIGPLAN